METVNTPALSLARHRARMRRRALGQSSALTGAGLAQIIIAIGVIGVIAYAVSQLITANSSSGQGEIENIDTLVTSEYGSLGVYTGLNNASLIASGHLPTNYYSGTSLITPWHGVINIGPTTNPTSGLPNGAWLMQLNPVPSGECSDLAVDHFSGQIGLFISAASASLTTAAPTTGGTAQGTVGNTYAPPTPSQASSACNPASAGSAAMTYEFAGN